jgi:cytochrome c553/uncharacterized protein (DUF302 family)
MRKSLLMLCLILLPLGTQAADLANGKAINKNCALCHGIHGQGTKGKLSPRLAGLPREYLVKAIKDYKNGVRTNFLMMKTAGIDIMTDADIEDISAYLSQIDLSKSPDYNIIKDGGDTKNGAELYDDDCKTCHGKDGRGKPKKEAPPLAGQHHEYIEQSIKMFQSKLRLHDNDKEDETFDDYSEKELSNITSHIATLDDASIQKDGKIIVPNVVAMKAPRPPVAPVPPKAPNAPTPKQAPKPPTPSSGLQITDIKQTVARLALEDGVSKEDAIQAMLSKATELNLKLVGEQRVSKELEARGVKTPYLSIFQFCDPMDARTMIMNNPIFASYMPCRISLVEDQNKKLWLMMLNLDMLIDSKLLAPEVVETAIRVNQSMLDIMVSGSTGEF